MTGERSVAGIPTLYALPVISFGSAFTEQPIRVEATAKATTKSVNQAHFAPGSHFGEGQPKAKFGERRGAEGQRLEEDSLARGLQGLG